MASILYLHGANGNPHGVKYQRLVAEFGQTQVAAPRLGFELGRPGWRNKLRIGRSLLGRAQRRLRAAIAEHRPRLIVASSLGAGLALQVDTAPSALLLFSPYWKIPLLFAARPRISARCAILHSPADSIVPIAWSRELLELNSLANEQLIEIGDDHRMNDQAALAAMLELARRLLAESTDRVC